MADDQERQLLASRQAALLDAMAADAPIPEGFDQSRVTLAGEALWRKRARGIAKSWPSLAASLGAHYSGLIEQYSTQFPTPPPGGPLADGYDFAIFLKSSQELEESALREFAAVNIRMYRNGSGLTQRKGPALHITRKRGGGYLIAIQIWCGKELWL